MLAARRGFTLVELLVVITIIALLIALLLPAVQVAREAARQAQCSNNMKQLGLAAHNYESAYGCFPPAGVAYGWCRNPQNYGDKSILNASGLTSLLPYLEQMALYSQYDQTRCAANFMVGNNCSGCGPNTSVGQLAGDAVASGNAKVVSTRLPVFTCPTDTGKWYIGAGGSGNVYNSTSLVAAKTNYGFSAGIANIDCSAWAHEASSTRRMFGENSSCHVSDVRDGLSNTVAFGETLHNVYNGSCSAWGYRGWVMVGVDLGAGINVWGGVVGLTNPQRGRLGSWGHVGSMHSGGAQVTMGDGAVRFLREASDVTVLKLLAIMADGQAVAVP